MSKTTKVQVTKIQPNDVVLDNGREVTVAVSEPDELNEGGWHLEMVETDEWSGGFPISIRFPSWAKVEVPVCDCCGATVRQMNEQSDRKGLSREFCSVCGQDR